MRIFITGATGFIGRNLATRLTEQGYSVICGVRSPVKLKSLSGKVKIVRIYLEDKDTIARALKEEHPDILYHCAALVDSNSRKMLHRVNVEGTRNVFDACLTESVKKIIYLSSVAVINGNKKVPLTENLPYKATGSYGWSKLEAEKVALNYREKGLKIAILRPCMVYGEGEPHLLRFLVKMLRRRLLPLFGRGDKKLHLVSVENVVDVLVLCLSKEKAYEGTYFIADKEILTIKEALDYMTKTLGTKPPISIPLWIVFILSKFPFIGKKVSLFLEDRTYSIERLKGKLGYVPRVSVYDGLKRAILSYR